MLLKGARAKRQLRQSLLGCAFGGKTSWHGLRSSPADDVMVGFGRTKRCALRLTATLNGRRPPTQGEIRTGQ
jgi:hypothetical protein